jgi:lysophospholipid acyltransferase
MLFRSAFAYLAKAIGASTDDLKQLFMFLSAYPLAAALKRIPDAKPWQKNGFIIVVSLFYLVGLFDLWDGIRTFAYSAIGTYAIAYYIDGSLMPWVAFVFLMGHMSLSHIQRQILNDPSVVDITGGQMVLIIKLSAFAWNVHDGRLKPELLTDGQKDRAIYEMPGLLDYAGYVLFFPSLFTGPAFDYVDYRRWLETTMFEVPPGTKPLVTRKQRKIPRSGTPAMWKAATGLVWIFLFLQLSPWYNVPVVLSDQYAKSYSFPRRVWLMYMLGVTTRMKYYGVWAITEGACIMAGIGFNGVDPATGKPKWDRLENVDAWGIETAQNSRAYLDNWNKNTNKWLRNYVYLRVTPKGRKPGFRATLATFITSAFWHGFYPGYYLTFLMGAFIQTVAKNSRRHLRPFFLTPDGTKPTPYKIYYDVAGYFLTQLFFSFTTAPFVILGFGDSLRVWARVYFYGLVGVMLAMAFFASPAKPYLTRKLEKRNYPYVRKTLSQETNYPPSLGLPSDPGRDIDDAIDEIRQEVEARRRRGSAVTMPSGDGLKRAIEAKMGRKLEFPQFTAAAGAGAATTAARTAKVEQEKVDARVRGAHLPTSPHEKKTK